MPRFRLQLRVRDRMTSCRLVFFFFSSRRRHTRLTCDWSSDVCSSDLASSRLLFTKLSLGQVNVFVGANGSGKSSLLEALGVLGAAADGRVDDTRLKEREIGRASCRERGGREGVGVRVKRNT